MSRDLFNVELGVGIHAENGDIQASLISGTAVPDGVSGQQSSAPIGSLYLRSGTGELYQKIANAGAPADWEINGSSSAAIGVWRSEKVQAITNDTVTIGVRDLTASPFADDDTPLLTAADFTVGDFIIADADGTPVLREVTAVSAPNVTFSAPVSAPALASNDTFIANNYLPDSPGSQEGKAIVNYNGSIMIKLGDIDWNFATGINLSAGYAASAGTVAPGDSVEEAIQKLDGNDAAQDLVITEIDQNVDDLITLSGVAENSTNLGAFAAFGNVLIGATETVKSAFQLIFDLMAQLRGVQATGVTSITPIDSVPVATVTCVKWLVEAFEEATPANRKAFEVFALGDASNQDETVYAKLRIGANFNVSLSVDHNAGDLRLLASSSTAGITVTARRIEVVKNVL